MGAGTGARRRPDLRIGIGFGEGWEGFGYRGALRNGTQHRDGVDTRRQEMIIKVVG